MHTCGMFFPLKHSCSTSAPKKANGMTRRAPPKNSAAQPAQAADEVLFHQDGLIGK